MKLNSYFGVDEGDTSYLVDKGDEAYANQLKLFELLENGKDYIVIKAPDDMSQSMSVTLPSEAGSSDYVLTWQDGNIMQWKDVSSISGISELIQVVTDFQKNGFTSVECVSGNCSYDGILDNIGVSYPLDLDKGGLGSDLSSPSEDKILFYDESEGRVRWLTVGDNLEIDGTELDAESDGVFGDTSPSGEVYTGEIYTAGNGLSVSGSEVQLGGTLERNTTITQSNYNLVYNLTGIGDFDVQDSGVSVLKIDDSGAVALGVSDPTSALDIKGSTQDFSSLRIRSGVTPLTPYSGDIYSDGTNIYFWNGSSWDDLTEVGSTGDTLPTGSEGQFLYNNDGTWEAFNGLFWDDGSSYIGLGTTNPQYTLDVDGTARFDSLRTDEIYLSGTQVTADAEELNILDGALVSTSELNVLNGVNPTLTASELNILDGALVSTSELNLLVGRSGTLIDTNNISSYAITPAIIGNYAVTSITAGSGLSQTSSGPGQVTLDIGAGDGIYLDVDSLSLQIATSGSFTSNSSFSGLELNSSGLSLLGGCFDDQVLAWDTDTQSWMCSSKLALGGITGSGSGVSTEGQVAIWNGGSNITGSDDLWFESSSGRLGIGTTSPDYDLHVVGSVAASDYFSSFGNVGATSNVSGMVFENGLYISGTIAGFLTPYDIGAVGGVQEYNSETSFLGQTIELSSSEVTGILPVSFGGTGTDSFTENALLIGSGTGPLGVVSVGQDGQILLGVTGSGPIFSTLTGDASVTNTGVLTLSSTSVSPGTYGTSILIPQITVDEKGRLTQVTEIDIQSSLLPQGTEGQMIYNNSGTWVAFDSMYWDDGSLSLGIGTTNPQSTLDVNGDITSTSIFTQTLYLSGTEVTALASELNVLNGILASTSELNLLAGATISTSELNVLTGILASTSELNVLNGILVSTSELNVLNGILASTSELNLLAGRTGELVDTNNIGTYAVTPSNASGYVITSITAGSGLSISSTGPGAVTLDVGAGDGVSVLDDTITLSLVTSGSSSSRSSVSGLELSSQGLSLIQGCTDDEVLSWDDVNGWWECSSKLGGGAVAVEGSPLDNQLAVWSGGGTSIKDSNLWFVSGMLGIGTSNPEYNLHVAGSLMALDFFSGDGTLGASTTVSGLTFEDGLYVSGTITGFLTAESYLGTVTSITAGSGMSFSEITNTGSITLGTPSSLSSTSTNLVSGTTHTHEITSYALSDTSDITFSGSPEILGSSSASASLATIPGLVSGTYGSPTFIPVFSVDAKGRVISAGSVAGDFQTSSSTLSALSALSYADGNIIVGNGTTWVVESGSVARTSLGLGTTDSPNFASLYLSGTQVTSNASELNILDGVNLTLTSAELNVLDGIAAGLTATELSVLDGIAAGLTSTELSLLDGRTGTLLDTNNIGTYALTPSNASSYSVTSITSGTGISLSGTGPGSVVVSLANSGVVSGTYGASNIIPVLSIDSTGRILLASTVVGSFLEAEADPIWSSSAASYFNLSENEVVTGRPSFNGGTSGSNAPFTVDSQYLVTNLNADLLDGYSYDNLPYIATNANLSAIGLLSPAAAGNMIIANGTTWVSQSGQTLLNTIGAQSQLSGTGFVKVSGTAVTYDNSTYLTADIYTGDITSVTAGSGLSGGGTTGDVTLNIGSGNGISVLADSISLNLVSSTAIGGASSSISGLEVTSSGLSLLRGCGNDEVLSWNTTSKTWSCSSKLGGGAITGAGASGQVAFFNGGASITGSDGFWYSSGKLGIGTSDPEYDLHVAGSLMALDYVSGEGNLGASTTVSGLTFEDGLYVSGTITGFLTPLDIGVVGGVQGYDANTTILGQTIELGSSEVTGTLNVSNGGTGTTSLTNYGLVVGSGTNPLRTISLGTDGQILLGVSGSDPSFGTLTGDAAISNTGVLTLSSTSVVSGTYGTSILIPQITVDEKGRLTQVTEIDIQSSLLPQGTEGQMIYNNSGTWVAFDSMYWDDGSLSLGIGTTNPQSTLDVNGDITSTSIFTQTLYLSGSEVTALASELNVLDGILASTSELNVLNGILASTSELNVLNGILASTSELNLLAGRTGILLDSVNIGTYAVTPSNASSYVITSITAGSGLSISSTGPGAVTLDIGAGDGISVLDDTITLSLSSSGTGVSTASASGLELTSNGLRLLGGCSDNQVLAWNSTSSLWQCMAPTSIGIVSGSGVEGQISFFTGTNTQSGSSNLFWDIANSRLGIGLTNPQYDLDVLGAIQGSSILTTNFFISGTQVTSSAVELNLLDGISGSLISTGNISSNAITSLTAGTGISLSGTGPGNVTVSLANSGVTAGTYGSENIIPTFSVDSKGRIIAASSVAVVESDPVWAAASSSYFNLSASNPTVLGIPSFNGGTSGSTPPFYVDSKYLVTNLNAEFLGGYGANNLPYVQSVVSGSGISVITSGTAAYISTVSLTDSGVTPGTYGSESLIPIITVDSKGRITSASNAVSLGDISQVTAGSGLSGGGTSGDVTLNIGQGDGISVLDDSITLNLVTSGSSSSRSSVSGLELSSQGLSLIQGCTDDEVLSWDSVNGWWECSSKLGGGAVSGSGTTGQIAYFNGSGSIAGNNSFWYSESLSRVGIGTSDPEYDLHVAGTLMALDYVSGEGNLGASTVVSGLTFEDGLYVSGTISGFLTSLDIGVAGGVQGYDANTTILGSSIDLPSEVTGILTVPYGGTGLSTLTDHGVLVGSGTGAITSLSVGTDGQILVGVTGADPVFRTLGGDIGSVSTSGSVALATISGLSAGTYGTSTDIPVFQVDSKGRVIVAGTIPGDFLESSDIGVTVQGYDANTTKLGSDISLTSEVSGVLPLANGGTGQNLSDPGVDRMMFWDDSASAVTWLTPGTGISISGTALNVTVTDTNTTYTAGNGLTLSGTEVQLGGTLSKDTTVTLGAYGMDFDLNSTGDFEIRDGTTSYLFVKEDGNVGIGITNPTDKLHVVGNILATSGFHVGLDGDGTLIDDASNGSSSTTLYIGNEYILASGDIGVSVQGYNANTTILGSSIDLPTEVTGTLTVPYGGTGSATLTSNGVLIGAGTGPVTSMTGVGGQIFVINSSSVPTFVSMSGDATISSTGALTLANSGVTSGTYGSSTLIPILQIDSKGRIILAGSVAGGFLTEETYTGDITGVGSMTSGSVFAGADSDGQWLGLGAAGGRIQFEEIGATDYIGILSANLGIGTTSPSQTLDVVGNIELNEYLYFGNASTEYLRWDASDFILSDDLLPSSSATYNLGSDTSRWNDLYLSGSTIHIGSSTASEGLISYANNVLEFSTSSTAQDISFFTDDLYIDRSLGYVGIGTTSPNARLEILGTGTGSDTSSLWVKNATGTTGLYVDDFGYVGIGTTSPQEKLHLAAGALLVDTPSPTLLHTEDTLGDYAGTKVYISGQYAYIADGGSGLTIIDISNPSDPTIIHTEDTPGSARGVFISGQYAYIADHDAGLTIIDISNPSDPTIIHTEDTPGSAQGVFISGQYAYIADYDAGLTIIDISNPSDPALIHTEDTDNYANEIYISGKYAYIANMDYLVIIDISDPNNPSIVNSFRTDLDMLHDARNIYISGKYAYIANYRALTIVDISDPDNPEIVSDLYSNDFWSSAGIYVSGKYAYMTSYYGLHIFDLGGADVYAANIGNIQSNDITVTENVDVGNNLYIRNGLNVGPGGLYSQGPTSIMLGAGVTSPQTALTVNQLGTGDILNLFNSTGEVLTLTSDGYLGIGTTNPLYKLDISSSTTDTIARFLSSDDLAQILLSDNDTTGYLNIKDSIFSIGLTSSLSNSNLNINSSGNVGIGTSSPGVYKLNVAGSFIATDYFSGDGTLGATSTVSGLVFKDGLYTSGTLPPFLLTEVGDISEVVAGDGLIGGGSSGSVTLNVVATNGLTDTADAVKLGGSLTETTTITQGNFDMVYNLTGTGNFDIQNTGVSTLYVSGSSGNVGIGTTAPEYQLDVVGTIRAQNFVTSGGMPVNDILLEQEVRNLSITAMTGSLGLDMTSNFVEKVSETTFNAGTTYVYDESTVALDNGNVFIAYRDSTANGTFVIYDSLGNIVKAETIFNSGTTSNIAATKINNGNILIGYSEGNDSKFVIYDSSGNEVISETNIASYRSMQTITSLTNGNILIVYTDDFYGYFVIYDSAGNLVKSDTIFHAGLPISPSATTLTNGNVLIAYRDDDDSDNGNFVIYDSLGNEVVSETTFNAGTTNYSSVTTLTNGNILIAYRDGGSSNYGNFVIYDSLGNLVVSETTFNAGTTWEISATTLTNGNILIAYQDGSSSNYGNFVVYDSLGNEVVSETTFNAGSTSTPSATTLTNGNIILAYQDASSSSYGNFVIYGPNGASFANLVGIGTTNPQEKLDVVGGNIRTDSNLIAGGAVLGYGEGTGVTDRLGGSAKFMTGTGYIYFDRNNSQITMNETTGDLSGHAYSDDLGWLDFGEDENPSGPVNVNLTSGSVTGKAYAISSGSYVDFTNYSSNVSVDLNTGIFTGYAWSEQFGWVDFSDSGVYFSNNSITTYAADQNLFINPEGDGVTFISGNVTIDGSTYSNAFSGNSSLRLQTAGIDRIYVDETLGYVGVGTTAPTSKLEIVGSGSSSSTSSLWIKNASEVTSLYVNDLGNVGIGTTNPQEKLDVVGGNIRTDSNLIAGGAVLGYGEGTGVTDRVGGAAKFMTGTGYIYFDRNNSQITMNETTGDLSGHAYSDDLGWIDFGEVENPSGPVNVNLTTGSVTGMAYVISSGSYVDFTNYSSNVSVNLTTGIFSGYVWAEEAGWVDFTDSGVYFSNNTITTYAADQNLFINPEGDGVTFISGNVTIDGTAYANAFSSNSPLRLQTAGIDRIYVDDTYGYVGIGNTNPEYMLDVDGTIRSDDLLTSAGISYNDHLVEMGQIGLSASPVLVEKVSETTFRTGSAVAPSTTSLSDGNILIAYEDPYSDDYGNFVIYDSSGNEVVSETTFNADNTSFISTATLTNGNILIAYGDNSSSNGNFVIYDSLGNLVVSETTFNAGSTTYLSATTLTNGNILIAYRDVDNTNKGTFVIYDSAGNQIKAPTVFANASTSYISATTLTNGNILIAYHYAGFTKGNFVIYDSVGNLVKSETTFNAASTNYISATTLNNGNILISYQDFGSSSYGNFVIYDSAGNPVKSETTFNAGTTYDTSATTLTNGNILIAYTDGSSSFYGNFVIYDSSGNEVVSETTFNADNTSFISTATLTNGNTLISYTDVDDSEGGFVIYGSSGASFANMVGIGTTAPTSMLEIVGSGTASSTSSLWVKNAIGTTGLFVNDSGYVGIGTTSPLQALEVRGNIYINSNSDSTNTLFFGDDETRLHWDGLRAVLDFRLGAWGAFSFNEGYVGIGTTAPSQELDVVGDIELNNYLYFGNGSTEYLRWDASNFILSDDLLPNANDSLNLGSTSYRWADIYAGPGTIHVGSTTTDEGTISYDTTNNIFNFGTDSTSNGDMAFFTDDLYIDKSLGYVGIGTTAPDYELDVLGTIQAYNFINSAGMPVNDILLEEEVRNLSITAMTGSLGLDMTSNFVVKKAETTFNAGSIQYLSATTLTNGNVLIAYRDNDSSSYGNFVIYDSAGNLVKSETTFNAGITDYPSATTLTNGNILIAYQDASSSNYGNFVIYDSAGNLVKSETTFNAGTTPNISATTLTNGNILIAYRDNSSSNGNFVIYDSAGNQVVSETTFNAGITDYPSATTLTNGNILIAYRDDSSSNYGNFVIYDSAGNQVVSETTFNAGTTNHSSANTLTNGNILIAYNDSSSNGNFVIYDSAGNLVKSETTFDAGIAYEPSVTTLTNGNILIAYRDDSSSNGNFVIYDSAGNLVQAQTTFNAGTTSQPYANTLTNGNVFIAYRDSGSSSYGNFVIYGSSGASFAGVVGIGTTAPTASLHVAGTLRFSNFGAGSLITDSSGNVSVSSDERLKDIQGSFDRGLEEILQLDPILYKWNETSGMETETTYAGLSAQDVQSVIPEAVGVDPNGYLTLSDRPVLAATINAIKEQQLQIEELRDLLIGEGKILESSQSSESLDTPTTDTGILSQIQTVFEEFKEMILTLGMTAHTDELGNNYLSIDSDVKMAGDLSVLGETTTSNLTVLGNIQAGTIEIDTAENSINVLGVSCFNPETNETNQECLDMTDQTLYLQKTSSGNLNIFNGKLVIEPNGTMKLDGNLEVTGTVKSDTVEADTVIIKETKTPDLELGSQCKPGEMTWDQDYIYVCTTENMWSRSKLELIPGQSAVQQDVISGSTEPEVTLP